MAERVCVHVCVRMCMCVCVQMLISVEIVSQLGVLQVD